MFDFIPVQFWLLILLGIAAGPSALHVVRHVRHAPIWRDITRPPVDLEWRTPAYLFRAIFILVVVGAFAVFIFTPQAARMAEAPEFIPILLAAFGLWALYSVGSGFVSGKIRPFVNHVSDDYDRRSQPKRFWASLTWNALLGGLMLWGSVMAGADAAAQDAEDSCFSEDTSASMVLRREACTDLVAIYDDVLRDDPSDRNMVFNRALANEMLGKQQAAIDGYSRSISLMPTDGDAYLNRGLLHLDQMDFDRALADFDRAHRLAPAKADPLANRGMAYAWKGRDDEARRDFARVRSIEPDILVAMRGDVLLAMNAADFRLAVDRATATLARHSDDPWTLSMRADAYRRLGDHRKSHGDTMRVIILTGRSHVL